MRSSVPRAVCRSDGQQRAQETATHPDTVRTLQRRFHQQGMLGLIPAHLKVTARGRAARVPDAIRQEIARLKALYAGFHSRELARIMFLTFGYPIHHNTVKQLWQQSPVPTPPPPHVGTIALMPIVPPSACRSSDCITKAGTR